MCLSGAGKFLIAVMVMSMVGYGEKFNENKFYSDAKSELHRAPSKIFGLPDEAIKQMDRLCGRFVMINLRNAGLHFPRRWGATQLSRLGCRWYASDIPSLDVLVRSADQLGIRAAHWSWPDLPSFGEVCESLGGTPHFFCYYWKENDKTKGHAGKLLRNGDFVEYANKVNSGSWWDLYEIAMSLHVLAFSVYRVCDENGEFNRCHTPQNFWSADSTIGGDPDDQFTVRHMWACCWKEKMPGEAPWRSRTTPYACLNWDETRGTTWDTLISPRANMAGCTSVVFIQSCTTNLQHGANKIIEIRGSTDDGVTWPYHIGTTTA